MLDLALLWLNQIQMEFYRLYDGYEGRVVNKILVLLHGMDQDSPEGQRPVKRHLIVCFYGAHRTSHWLDSTDFESR
jgi:hypothetical protein